MEDAMPSSAIKGPEAEKTWDKAKEAAKKQYGNIEKSNPDKFFALTMTIYKSMCTKHNCSPKDESMSSLIMRLELTEALTAKLNLPKDYIEWQLVGSDDNGMNKEAVKDLNNAMKKASSDILKVIKLQEKETEPYDEDVLGKAIAKAFKKHLESIMKKHSDVGANDTEPRYEAIQRLIDFVKGYYGITGWTNLGDYI